MKTGRSLTDLAAEIERQGNAKRDLVGSTAVMGMIAPAPGQTGAPRLVVNDHGEFGIGPIAHRQIAERVKIPATYYDRMQTDAPHLLASNVNHWFKAKPEARMVRTLDGTARAFLSDRFRPIDNLPVAEAALAALQEAAPDMEIASCEVTERRLYLKATFPRIQGEVKKGDVVQAGLLLQNSEVGLGALEVSPFSMRLVCLNGMVHTEFGQRRNHVGRHTGGDGEAREFYADDTLKADDRALLLKIRDTVKLVASETAFQRIVGKMREAEGAQITGDPAKAVEVLAERFHLNDGERGGVLRHLIAGGSLSAWGLANAVTRAAEDADSYDRATELERMGGQIIELPRQDWRVMAEAA